eukprot:TRINITY_DN2097_c1_g1_i8.p1 TRINITY_DN2097_c1_g1~~TRINITY_DN2097_c1_g1_i8.p1  ORF type:complete len:294 (-),score=55.09 TRINITY_DN2097_c1_g1_i8:451-1332(-)
MDNFGVPSRSPALNYHEGMMQSYGYGAYRTSPSAYMPAQHSFSHPNNNPINGPDALNLQLLENVNQHDWEEITSANMMSGSDTSFLLASPYVKNMTPLQQHHHLQQRNLEDVASFSPQQPVFPPSFAHAQGFTSPSPAPLNPNGQDPLFSPVPAYQPPPAAKNITPSTNGRPRRSTRNNVSYKGFAPHAPKNDGTLNPQDMNGTNLDFVDVDSKVDLRIRQVVSFVHQVERQDATPRLLALKRFAATPSSLYLKMDQIEEWARQSEEDDKVEMARGVELAVLSDQSMSMGVLA